MLKTRSYIQPFSFIHQVNCWVQCLFASGYTGSLFCHDVDFSSAFSPWSTNRLKEERNTEHIEFGHTPENAKIENKIDPHRLSFWRPQTTLTKNMAVSILVYQLNKSIEIVFASEGCWNFNYAAIKLKLTHLNDFKTLKQQYFNTNVSMWHPSVTAALWFSRSWGTTFRQFDVCCQSVLMIRVLFWSL